MNILMITQEPPLQSAEVVSGNAVRSIQINNALEAAGHAVTHTWLNADRLRAEGSFHNRDELQGLLLKHSPDAVIVAYWELLGLLPSSMTPFIILDFVAPRSLEEMFESPATVRSSMRRLRINLERCDAVMVGNSRQQPLLINTLIEAGFDLRDSQPILTVPLGAETVGPPLSTPDNSACVLVSGGVTWPWRNSGTYGNELEKLAGENLAGETRPAIKVVHFGGRYRWHEQGGATVAEKPAKSGTAIDYRALVPYRQFSKFLSENAHIGVELAEWNLERQFSQSFRSLEFLRHGLPLLCNRYLPLSELIERYDAGWIVDEPASLKDLLERIVSDPVEWRMKSENALRLVQEEFQPQNSASSLLSWLEAPGKAARLPPLPARPEHEPVLGIPPLKQRLKRQFSLIRRVVLGRIFGQAKGKGVLFVTRSDLFPVDHGAAVRTVETARALSRRGLPVGIVTDDRKHWYRFSGGQEERAKYPLWVRLLSLPGPLVKLLHFSKDLPFSNSFLYLPLTDSGFQWRTIAAARVLEAGVLQAEFPAYAKPCIQVGDVLNCSVVLVEHNVEYERIKAQVEELGPAQYENLKAIEISLCNQSDAVVCVSDNDRQVLAMDGVASRLMHTIAHGVNLKQYDAPPVANFRDRFGIGADAPVLIYHGTFSYPPNREALRVFSEIILPGLEDRGLLCHVLAVGRSPPATSPHDRIHFTGSVEQVAPWLKTADLAVIPLTDGGGTRMKIIDCFAAGLPVISTSKGIEGIPVISGRQALVLDDWDSIIEAICDLWGNPEKAQSLAKAGREMAASLDWDTVAGQYISIYADLA